MGVVILLIWILFFVVLIYIGIINIQKKITGGNDSELVQQMYNKVISMTEKVKTFIP